MDLDNIDLRAFIKGNPASVVSFSGRIQGKSFFALQYSAENNVPIVCNAQERADQLKAQGKAMGIDIPEPYVVSNNKPKERYGPSILIDAAKAIQNAALIEEMLKYRFKRKK